MTHRPSSRPTATSTLIYWLTLVSGLAVLTALRPNDLDTMGALWAGSVAGSAVGQLLAWQRLRIWLVMIAVIMSCWLALPIVAGLHVSQTLRFADVGLLPLAAGAFAGYLSLSERGALAAFWFPAVPWMLAMLQSGERVALRDAVGLIFLGGLGALFFAFLRARETRRVALWQGHASERIAPAEAPAILRARPLRAVAHAAWMVALGATTIGITQTVAPSLWGHEVLRAGVASTFRGERPCCNPDERRERVNELVPILDAHALERRDAVCVECRRGIPVHRRGDATADSALASTSPTAGGATSRESSASDPTYAPASTWSRDATRDTGAAAPDADLAAPAHVAPTPPATTTLVGPLEPTPDRQPTAAPHAATPPASLTDAAQQPAPPPIATAPVTARAPENASSSESTFSAHAAPASGSSAPPPAASPMITDQRSIAWLFASAAAFLAGVLALSCALRSLRRLLVVRHLRRPIWTETVDQRVSNLWELMLIGLHDAGFRVAPGEQPLELARRIGLDGITTCASVLERARHGVRVDAADIEAMTAAAEAVYATARARAGALARAAAALRWPLA